MWFVSGKAFAGIVPSAERTSGGSTRRRRPGRILTVRVADLSEKDAVLATSGKAFFTIPHFDGYTAVLIKLRNQVRRGVVQRRTSGDDPGGADLNPHRDR